MGFPTNPGQNLLKSVTRRANAAWLTLTTPAAAIEDPAQLRRARLVSSLLVGSLAVLLTALPVGLRMASLELFPVLVAIGLLVIAYALNRAGHYIAASTILIGAVLLALVLADTNLADTTFEGLVWGSLAIILGGILFPEAVSLGIAAVLSIGEIGLGVFFPSVEPKEIFLLVFFNAIVAVLTLVHSRHRDLLEQDRQAELAAANQQLEDRVAARTAELTAANDLLRQEILLRNQLEDALQEDEERFRTVTEQALVGVYIIQDGLFRYVNPMFAGMFGYPAEEIVDRLAPVDLTYPDDRPIVEENINRRMAGEVETTYYQFRGLRLDGGIIQCEVLGRRVSLQGQSAIIGTVLDITERKLAEDAIRERETRFRKLFELSPDAIVLIDPHTTDVSWPIVDCNEVACQMNGYSRDELIGRSIDILHTGAEPPAQRDEYLSRLRREGTFKGETMHRRKDGALFPITYSTSLITLGDRELVLGIDRDVTERKRMEAAEREQRAFAQNLAEIAAVVNSTLDLDEVLNHILDSVSRVIQHVAAADVMLVENGIARVMRLKGYDPRQSPEEAVRALRFPVADFPSLRWMMESRQPVLVADTQADPTWKELPETSWIRCYMAAPIRVDAEVIGFVNLDSPIQGAFTPADKERLQAFADQAAVAIKNARLYESASRRATRLEVISQIGQRTTAILDIDDLLHQAVGLIEDAFHYGGISILLVDGDHIVLRAATLPAMRKLEGSFKLHIGAQGVTGRVAATGEAMLVPNVDLEQAYVRPEGKNAKSELAVPIKLQNMVLGVLNVEAGRPSAFSEADVFTLQTIADQLAPAIQNAKLYQGLADYNATLAQAVEQRTDELQRTKDHIEAILNSVGEAVVVIGKDSRIRQVNPAFLQQTGYLAQEIELRDHREVLHDATIPDNVFHQSSAAMRDGLGWHGEMPVRRKDGTIYEAAVTISPLRNEKNEVVAFVGALRDITALKEVERMKDRFVSNVSHELRTPITSIRLIHDLIRRNPVKQAVYLERMGREISRLDALIEALLLLSRLDQGRVELNLTPVDLNEIAQRFAADRGALAQSRGLRLTFKKSKDLPPVQADDRLLDQAVSVFLTNAINYTPSGGQVMLRTRTREWDGKRWGGISVGDTGPGIPPDEQPKLFERFFRGSVGRNSGAPGTGLGLAISKEIADRLGGEIELRSEGLPGKGATFTLWLPVPELAMIDQASSPPIANSRKKRDKR